MRELPLSMIAFILIVVLAWIGCTLAIIFAVVIRKQRAEIRRLIGKVPGFIVSGLKQQPESIVHYLRSDANMCHLAGQCDMSDRLRGYASRLERWIDDKQRGVALRRIANGG